MRSDNWLSSGLWTLITVLLFMLSLYIYRRANQHNLLHPIIVASALVLLVLMLSGQAVSDYQAHTAFLNFMLIPATIALAVPLYQQLAVIRELGFKVLLAVLLGGALAPMLTVAVLFMLDFSWPYLASAATKSITTPLAISTASLIAGEPSLAATMVILTGLIGAACSARLFAWCNVKSDVAQGLALGTVAHAIGVAQAVTRSQRCAGFATLALCVNGIVTAVALPLLYWLFVD